MAERGRIRVALLAGTLGLAGLAAAACGEIAGEPRPVLASIDDGESPGGPAVASVDELDLCELLTPADFPVAAAPGEEPLREVTDSACVWTVSIDNAVGTFSAGVSARRIVFRDFVPPPGSPNGRAAEIDHRQAWIGNAFGPADVECAAVFGAADGTISVSTFDFTDRGIDACETVTGLAETVIARTPPPTG